VFKISKNKAILVFFAKVLLFALVLYFLYLQVKKIDLMAFFEIQLASFSSFFAALLLVFANQFFEFLKWDNTLKTLEIKTDIKTKFASYMAGNLSGFLTPNLLGNFIGRLFYFERRNRISLTFLTLVSNTAQFVASMFFGLIGILMLGLPRDFYEMNDTFLLLLLLFFLSIFLLGYFSLFKISKFLFQSKKWMIRILDEVKMKSNFLLKQLIFSFLRHFVFSLQYFLLLLAFGLHLDLESIFYIWQIYFWSTLIPSLWFGKLFIRESVALWILGQITTQTEIVLLSSVTLWFINQVVPALIGIPYFKFSKK
jgi:uncharacterized membrane protein YbhN (UPF0104 family)